MKKLLVKMVISLFLFSLMMVLPEAIAQSKEEPSQDDPHKKLFKTKCKQCHSLERIKGAHLTKEKAKETVEKMRKKEGANISKEEADSIYEYLGNYFIVPPSPPIVPAIPK